MLYSLIWVPRFQTKTQSLFTVLVLFCIIMIYILSFDKYPVPKSVSFRSYLPWNIINCVKSTCTSNVEHSARYRWQLLLQLNLLEKFLLEHDGR